MRATGSQTAVWAVCPALGKDIGTGTGISIFSNEIGKPLSFNQHFLLLNLNYKYVNML